MLKYFVAMFSVCFPNFHRGGSVRVHEPAKSSMDAWPSATFLEKNSSSGADPRSVEGVVHIIGDTRGDNKYLLRCLESTKRVQIETQSGHVHARWAAGMSENEDWKIVILGDFIGVGARSRDNLLILKALTEDPSWGKRLVVLLGDRESKLLRAIPDYSDGPFFFKMKHMQDLNAVEGSEGHELISWLRQRSVVDFSHGLLMMHGGLSKCHAEQIATEIQCQVNCGYAVQAFVNNISNRFYERLHQFYLSGNQDLSEWGKIGQVPEILSDHSRKGPGVLNYRGWSSKEHGAGSESTCYEAEKVGAYFGPHSVMVVAHTTHPRIIQFCDHFKVPIFVVDTHPSECSGNYHTGCDHVFSHDKYPRYSEADYDHTYQLPQSLKITQKNGLRELAACYERNHDAYCTVLREDSFGDNEMESSDTLSSVSTAFEGSDLSFLSDGSDLSTLSYTSDESLLSDSADEPSDGERKRKRLVQTKAQPSRKHQRSKARDVKESGGDVDVLTDLLGSWNPWLTLDDVDPRLTKGGSIAVLARLRIKPGSRREFEDAFEEIAKGVRAEEPEVSCYQLVRSQVEESVYEVIQIYGSYEALENHVIQPHFLRGSKKVFALVLAKPLWQSYSIVGTNGGNKL